MIRMNSRSGLLKLHKMLVAFICVCLLLCGCGLDSGTTKVVLTTGLAADEVFRIESISCYKPEMMVYLTNMQNQYESVYGPEIWETQVDGESLEQNVKDNALAKMAQVKTMNLMAQQMEIELDAQEEKIIEKAANTYYDSLNNAEIDAMGIDRDTITMLYREYMVAQKVYLDIIKDINPEVSDDEARNISFEYILVRTYAQDGTGKKIEFRENARESARARADEAYERAIAGENFEDLIIEYNEDPTSSMAVGKSDIEDATLRNILFDMAKDEISPVLTVGDGYLIVKIISTYDIADTDANKITIVETQREEVFGEEYDDFVENLTRKLNDTLWDNISFVHNPEVTTSDFFAVADEIFGL